MELNKSMFRVLSLESMKDQDRLRHQESFHDEFIITDPVHFTTHRDRKDNIPAFFNNDY